MTRPFVEVEIKGKKLNAVLDTGAWHSYILKEFANGFPKAPVEPFKVRIGGRKMKFKEVTLITGVVKDSSQRKYLFSEPMFEVSNIGEEEGKRIEILLGAFTLQHWGTKIDNSLEPPAIDFVKLRKGVFIEL